MRPERIELSTSGLKDRRSLGLVKTPLTTELRALTHPCVGRLCLSFRAGVAGLEPEGLSDDVALDLGGSTVDG